MKRNERASERGRGTPSRKRSHFVFLGHPSWSPRIFIVLAAGKNMFYLYFIFFPLSFFPSLSPSLFFFSPCRVSWSEMDAAHRGFARGDHAIWSWDTGSPACLRRRNSGYILCSLRFLLTPPIFEGNRVAFSRVKIFWQRLYAESIYVCPRQRRWIYFFAWFYPECCINEIAHCVNVLVL